jgi:hypothetical protein
MERNALSSSHVDVAHKRRYTVDVAFGTMLSFSFDFTKAPNHLP